MTNHLDIVPFGRHKGVMWKDVPVSYLEFLKVKNNSLMSGRASYEIDIRTGSIPGLPPVRKIFIE